MLFRLYMTLLCQFFTLLFIHRWVITVSEAEADVAEPIIPKYFTPPRKSLLMIQAGQYSN